MGKEPPSRGWFTSCHITTSTHFSLFRSGRSGCGQFGHLWRVWEEMRRSVAQEDVRRQTVVDFYTSSSSMGSRADPPDRVESTMRIEDPLRIQRILFPSLPIDRKFILINAGVQPNGGVRTAGVCWRVPTGLSGKCEGQPLDVSAPCGRDVEDNADLSRMESLALIRQAFPIMRIDWSLSRRQSWAYLLDPPYRSSWV